MSDTAFANEANARSVAPSQYADPSFNQRAEPRLQVKPFRLEEPLSRPLRVSHINAALIPAGIEYWLAAMNDYVDPDRMQFTRTVVLTDWVDARQVRRVGMPVEVGGRESVIAAASSCDIMLISDPGGDSAAVANWILQAKPALVVFVAHGDGAYTQSRIDGIKPAVDHVIAVTDHVRGTVCNDQSVSVILNGVDPKRLVRTQSRQQSRLRFGFSKDDFVVGFVGRYSEEKNPDLVLQAVERLPQHVKVLMVGHGNMEDVLMRYCMKRLPGRAVMVEGDGNLGDLYAAMDTLVMPSRQEGYGLVAMEAMMSGVPVVATPIGVIADLVTDHVHGLIVNPKASDIAEAVMKLASFPSLRKGIQQGGRQLAEKTGYASQMTVRYEDLLTRLWSEKTGGNHAHR